MANDRESSLLIDSLKIDCILYFSGDTYDPQLRTDDGNIQGGSGGAGQPIMMTFKRFLATQDDSITDEEAISKYQDYKMEYKRQELHKFFLAHKDEEWYVPGGW